MNERIKILADRASDYAGDQYSAISPLPDWNQYEPTWFRHYTERLAQLVVEECIACMPDDQMDKTLRNYFGITQ